MLLHACTIMYIVHIMIGERERERKIYLYVNLFMVNLHPELFFFFNNKKTRNSRSTLKTYLLIQVSDVWSLQWYNDSSYQCV